MRNERSPFTPQGQGDSLRAEGKPVSSAAILPPKGDIFEKPTTTGVSMQEILAALQSLHPEATI